MHATSVQQVYSYDQLVREVLTHKSSSATSNSKDGESHSKLEVLELTRSTLQRLQLPRTLSAIEEQATHAR
jgi:hypothetical protein